MTTHEMQALYGRHWGAKESTMTAAQLHRREGMLTAVEMIRARAEWYSLEAAKASKAYFLATAERRDAIQEALLATANEIERAIDKSANVCHASEMEGLAYERSECEKADRRENRRDRIATKAGASLEHQSGDAERCHEWPQGSGAEGSCEPRNDPSQSGRLHSAVDEREINNPAAGLGPERDLTPGH